MKVPSKAKLDALEALLEETAALGRRWPGAFGAQPGAAGDKARLTPGMREALERLDERGAITVPEIARARGVSRQHVQLVVNGLVEFGWATFVPNPAHRRSRLVQLTEPGAAVLSAARREERARLSRLPLNVSKKELRGATTTLRQIRMLFERAASSGRAGS